VCRLRGIFLERALSCIGRWLVGEAAADCGRPRPLLLQLVSGSVFARVLGAALLPEVIAAVRASETAAQFADTFCRTVSLEAARGDEVDR
jgi:hypothetical protein